MVQAENNSSISTAENSMLKILLVSDEHENWPNLDLLMSREQPGSFDFVFMSGDQANCNNTVDIEDEGENEQAEASNRRFVETLTALHKPEGKLYYIPGNHDAAVLLDPKCMAAPINETSVNLHNRVAELVPGLFIAGLGGSLPTKFKKDGETDWVDVFTPYPYQTEADYTAAIRSLWTGKVEPAVAATQGKSVILMTHDGPQDFYTANARGTIGMGENRQDFGFHKFGSSGLAELLYEQRSKLVVNIHGHCHDGGFLDRVTCTDGQEFPVCNPGSLN